MTPEMHVGVAALCAAIGFSAGLLAQDAPADDEMLPERQRWHEALDRFRTPGEQHARLAAREGKWTVRGRIWQAADAPPDEFTATSRIKAILDGRYILEKIEGELMDEPFEGVGIFGYDNLTQSYVGVWIDNFGTGIQHFVGAPSSERGIIHWEGEQPNVMLGAYEQMRSVGRDISDNEHVYTSYGPAPDSRGEIRQMEMRYIRADRGY